MKQAGETRFTRFPILLFDLGGVLVRWDGVDALTELTSGRLSKESARRFWLTSDWVRRFEKGICSPMDFAAGAVEELGLGNQVQPQEFLQSFFSWDRGPLPEAQAILEELGKSYHLACLSNNNSLHWPRIRDEFGFGRYFERTYLSHEIGLIKPDPEVFHYVIRDLGVPPNRILFFDDNIECVDSAREAGMGAELTRGVEDIRRIITGLQ